jgi:hypothetical protein
MVVALSIVRFRTAIKEPMDLVFLYWAISVGIICGAGLSEIAIILSVVVTLAVLVLNRIPLGRAPMILVINAEKQGDAALVRQENTWDIWGNADAEMEVGE